MGRPLMRPLEPLGSPASDVERRTRSDDLGLTLRAMLHASGIEPKAPAG